MNSVRTIVNALGHGSRIVSVDVLFSVAARCPEYNKREFGKARNLMRKWSSRWQEAGQPPTVPLSPETIVVGPSASISGLQNIKRA